MDDLPPCGTRDFGPAQAQAREDLLEALRQLFRSYGAVPIETPVMECREPLLRHYGDGVADEKLLFDLAGGSGAPADAQARLALRYDLTVPLARFMRASGLRGLRRYHIAKVYRRDHPSASSGRFREFYQCDLDVCGGCDPALAELECLQAAVAALCGPLGFAAEDIRIRVNDRRALVLTLAASGVPSDALHPVTSAIDKLDKKPWPEVADELRGKGLGAGQLERLGRLLGINGDSGGVGAANQLDAARARVAAAGASAEAVEAAFRDLDHLLALWPAAAHLPCHLEYAPALARGLDYYTGLIFEVTLAGDGRPLGSVAGGGRYDGLGPQPMAGVSIGFDRIFDHWWRRQQPPPPPKERATCAHVLAAAIPPATLPQRMELARELRAAGLWVEVFLRAAPKLAAQRTHALERGIPYLAVVGPAELDDGTVQIIDLASRARVTVARPAAAALLRHLMATAAAVG